MVRRRVGGDIESIDGGEEPENAEKVGVVVCRSVTFQELEFLKYELPASLRRP